MENRNQGNYQLPETSHKSLSCICCSCGEEDKEIVASQSNSAIRCKCWESNSPPRPPEAWHHTFDELVRQWSNRTQKRGSEDHIQPYFPTPGEVRIMFGRASINGIPEYATGYSLRDPQEWRPEAFQAPSINQQTEEWARWERATLHVSIKSFDPVTGSHFSLGSTWNPGAPPNFNSNNRNSQPQLKSETDELDTKRANVESLLRRSSLSNNEKQDVISAFLKNTVLNPSDRVEATTAMLRRSTATYDEKKRTLFSALKANADKLDNKKGIARAVINALIPDSNTQSTTFMQIFNKTSNEDPDLGSDCCSQIMNDVTMLTKGREIENDQTRADVESLVRTSPLNAREKVKVIDRLLMKNILDPNLRKIFAESMIRRCVMDNDERRANIISILQDADISPSSKAEVIAIILEEDSESGYEIDDTCNLDAQNVENMINEVVSGTAIPDSGYSTSMQKSDSKIRVVDSSRQDLRVGTSKTKYGNMESLRSIRNQVSKASIKQSQSQIDRSQTSAITDTNVPPQLLDSLTSQGQRSGQLYSTTNMDQPSKYSNLDLQGQSPSQMCGSQRDSNRDICTGNVESVRSMKDQGSKASFKPSRIQMDRSQTSAIDNTSIPPHLLDSSTSQGQHSGQLYSTTDMNQPSKHSHVDVQGQSQSQMNGSQRDLKEDVSKTTYTNNVESLRSMRNQVSQASVKPSHSQMNRSQTSAIDIPSNPSHLFDSSTFQGQDSGELSSSSNMNQNSSNQEVKGQSSRSVTKADISKSTFSGIMESLRSIRDQVSKSYVKQSESQIDKSQPSAMDNTSHVLDSSTSQGTTNMNSKYSNQEIQGPSTSQIYGSRRDIKGDASKTTYNGNVESLRSVREQVSKGSVKPSHSQIDRGEMSDTNKFIESHGTTSIISHHLPPDEIRSSITLNDDEKLVDLELQEKSLPKKSVLCAKCNYIKTCGCTKLCKK